MGHNVIVYGAGGHALVVGDAIRAAGNTVVGYVDTVAPGRQGSIFDGAPVLASQEEVVIVARRLGARVAFGFGECSARFQLLLVLSEIGLQLETVIHPSAVVSPQATVKDGAYIGPQAVVESMCLVEAGVIVNCCACVCHEVRIGRAATVCPGVMIGGKSVIGDRAWLGIGTTVIEKITIGEGSFIGAGAVVVSDLPSNILAFGVPAKTKVFDR